MIAEVRPGVAPTSTDPTTPDDIDLGGGPPRQGLDFERLVLAAAFEAHVSDIDAAELPSFRPLVRGVPSPHRTPHTTPRPSLPSAETSPAATAPLPFNRARALAAAQTPLQATSSRRELRPRRRARRSAGPFMLVCLFLAGAVAGLGGAHVTGAERVVDDAIEGARAVLTSLLATVASPEIHTRGGPEAARSALDAAADNSATADAGIAVTSGHGEQARASDARDQSASTVGSSHIGTPPRAEDVPALSDGGAATEMMSDGVHATAMMPPSISDRSPAKASFALVRGDEAMRQRDVIAARRFYEFAAAAGVAGAATAVARTYDPLYLQQVGVRGVQADPETALRWYKRARQEADTEARTR